MSISVSSFLGFTGQWGGEGGRGGGGSVSRQAKEVEENDVETEDGQLIILSMLQNKSRPSDKNISPIRKINRVTSAEAGGMGVVGHCLPPSSPPNAVKTTSPTLDLMNYSLDLQHTVINI